MYRKYIDDLVQWDNSKRRKPLMVWGARQVGKTYLIKNIFANDYYKDNYVYIDCHVETEIVEYFENHKNVQDIIQFISIQKNKTIDKNTLLIFDEAQECLSVVTMMKYFYQDLPEIPVIVTGSMVRIKIQRQTRKRGGNSNNKFLFPVGKINQLTIYPLNFKEYLWNRNKVMYEIVCDSFLQKKALDKETHAQLLNVFYEYLLIGGMPEAVDVFLETRSYLESRRILKDIYDNYLSDMALYQASPESIVRSRNIFESIYALLNKESKNFKPSVIESGAKGRDMVSPLDWLEMSHIILKSKLIKEKVTSPLIGIEERMFRLYLSDMGLFSYQSGVNASEFINGKSKNTLSGVFFENYVAIELNASNLKLFYWKGKGNAEFEFLIDLNSSIIPIDVKKNRGTMNSLEKYKNHNRLSVALKVSANQYGFDEDNQLLTIPFYYFFLFLEDLENTLNGNIDNKTSYENVK